MNDEKAIEAELQAKGLNAPRITPEHIDAQIVGHGFSVFPASQTTVCCIRLKNGFSVIGTSACASPENFDAEMGQKIAYKNAREKIWELEGYTLRNVLSGRSGL
jgi:Phage protein (N4 Gp49/phage Sf6 gene 66) family